MQWTAQAWLVYTLTHSKFLLGVISACGTAPMLVLSLYGGMTADRISKRKILLYTQSAMMLSALALGSLVISGYIHVWHIIAAAIVTGTAAAFDMPTRQAFVREMVERDYLMNAIGLNSSIFNAARIVGPAFAGMVMADLNIGLCFILNGLSFIAVIWGLALMKFEPKEEVHERETFWNEIKEGFSYVLKNRETFWLLLSVSVIGVFGFSYGILIPAFARDILHVEEKGYGILLAAGGIGAMLAALSVATISKSAYSKRIIVAGMILFSGAVGIFAFSKNYNLSVVMLALAAYGITAFFACANTFVQMSVSDDMRGRIMGIWTFVFGGAMPLGSLQMGFLGEHLGPPYAVFIGAAISLLVITLLGVYLFRGKVFGLSAD